MRGIITSLIALSLHTCFASQTLVWDSTPINIEVPVSANHAKQVQVHFPVPIKFGWPVALEGKLNVQNDNQTIYLSAPQAFDTVANVPVKTKDHKVVLLNISANANARADTINVVYKKDNNDSQSQSSNDAVSHNSSDTSNHNVSTEALLRYSIQQFYAPKRLLKTVPGISERQRFNGKTYNLVPDGSLTAMPLASFSGGGTIITAVLVRNNLNIPVDVTPSMVCGHWIGFAPFPNSRLMPREQHGDSTTLFLLSHADFLSVYDGGCPHEVA